MKRIILSLLTLVLLFSCQSEEDIEPMFVTYPDDINTRSSFPEYDLFNLLCPNYKAKLGYSHLIPLTKEERNSVAYSGVFMIGFYPFMKQMAEKLLNKNITIGIGIDTQLKIGNGYYSITTNNIFFRKGYNIQYTDIMHELLHAIQHHIMGYAMNSATAAKNIEYEACVARDILECISRNGDFSNCPAMGIPNSRLEQDYRLWIHTISVYAIGKDMQVASVIKSKFNTWAKEWNSYNDKDCSETFVPLLLQYITMNSYIKY